MHINFLRHHGKFCCACAILLGAMSFVVSMRRPSAADVKPGSELYDTIIRALRGEYQWRRPSDPNGVETQAGERFSMLKDCHTVASVTEENFPTPFNTNRLETLPNTETPPINSPYHVHNVVEQTATVENNEQMPVVETTDEPPAVSSTTTATINSTVMVNTEVSGEHNVPTTRPIMRCTTPVVLLDDHDTPPVQCSVAQKLQKISQADKTPSTKLKPHSKYKPPYKIEKTHKPSIAKFFIRWCV